MKSYLLLFTLFTCIAFISCNNKNKAIQTIKGNEILAADLDSFIQNQIDSLEVAGVSVAIIHDNKIVYNNAFGFKNLTTKEKCTTETLFEACSLSKPVFAYFVLVQVEKGILDLDTPLYSYLPLKAVENDPRHKLITARMVLNHASGLPNWRKNTGGELKLLFEPGTAFGYSGEGYQYLKNVLKHLLDVDDEGLDQIFQEDVVKPLNLDAMRFTWEEYFSSRKAFGHRDGKPTDNGPKLLHDRADTFGAGYSLHTTATGYAKFLIHLMHPPSQNEAFIDQLLSQQFDMPKEKGELHRSIAFPVKKAGNDLRYYHSGNNGDYRAYCHFYKERGFGIVLLSNSDTFFASDCAKNIIEFLEDHWFYV